MKLHALTLDNLLAYEHAECALGDGITLVFGPNGSGKTALAKAVELGLSGSVLDLHGLTLDRLLRIGAASGSVTVQVARDGAAKPTTITRTLTAKGSTTKVNGRPITKDVYDFYAPEGLAQPEAVFRVLCNVSGFFDLDPVPAKAGAKQKDLLLALVDQRVPAEALAGLPLGDLPAPKTLADIEAAYRVAYDLRTTTRRTLGELPKVTAPAEPLPDVAAIKARLAELEADERRLIAVTAETKATRATLTTQRVAVVEALDRATIQLGELGSLEAAESEVASLGQMVAEEKARAKPRAQMPEPTQTVLTPEPAAPAKFVAPAMPPTLPSVPPEPARQEREAPAAETPDEFVCPLAHLAKCALETQRRAREVAR